MSSGLCKKAEGAIFPLLVEAMEDGVDDAFDAEFVDEADHRAGAAADFHEAAFDDVGSAQFAPQMRRQVEEPEEAGKILHRHVPTQDATVAAGELKLMKQYENSSSSGAAIGALDQQRVARSIALMQGANAIPAGLTPDRLVDFGLTPKG